MRVNFADEICSQITMRELVMALGFVPNRAGFISCPFHNERTASLKVYNGANGFHCFGCGKGGSVIDFVKEYYGLDFYGACERLNDLFRLGLPVGKLDLRSQKRAIEQARARNALCAAIREQKKAIYLEYELALTIWCACDWMIIHYEPYSDAWTFAVKNIDAAAYRIDAAESKVRKFESTRDGSINTKLDSGRLSGSRTV